MSFRLVNDGLTCSIGGKFRFAVTATTNAHAVIRTQLYESLRLVPRQAVTLNFAAYWQWDSCREGRFVSVVLRSGESAKTVSLRHLPYPFGVCTPLRYAPDFGPVDQNEIYFKNDLSQPVILARCTRDASASCSHPYYRDRIAPKAVVAVNISQGPSIEWAVESASGQLLRCVRLYWKYGYDQDVRLSQAPNWATPCPRKTPTAIHVH